MSFAANPAFIGHLKKQLAHHIDVALLHGQYQSIDNCPVDTSSLQESIRIERAAPIPGGVKGALLAGGEDYRGQLLSTGKEGNLVDYAMDQEVMTGFLSSAAPIIIHQL